MTLETEETWRDWQVDLCPLEFATESWTRVALEGVWVMGIGLVQHGTHPLED